jgi:hypothetical protein
MTENLLVHFNSHHTKSLTSLHHQNSIQSKAQQASQKLTVTFSAKSDDMKTGPTMGPVLGHKIRTIFVRLSPALTR